jgi:hypothetical protein
MTRPEPGGKEFWFFLFSLLILPLDDSQVHGTAAMVLGRNILVGRSTYEMTMVRIVLRTVYTHPDMYSM